MSHPNPREDYEDDRGRWEAECGVWEQLRRDYDEWLANTDEQLEFEDWLKEFN